MPPIFYQETHEGELLIETHSTKFQELGIAQAIGFRLPGRFQWVGKPAICARQTKKGNKPRNTIQGGNKDLCLSSCDFMSLIEIKQSAYFAAKFWKKHP